MAVPTDPLDAGWLRAEVVRPGGRWTGLDVVAETGSTNADLADRLRRGEAGDGTVLVADFQSAGRGRQGRSWTAPAGSSIAMSVLVLPARTDGWTWLPLLAGMAVADGLRAVAGVDAALKWPNDVLVDEAKICGVLAERVESRSGAGCVLGIGINVHLTRDELPVPTATSLAVLRPDRHHVRQELVATVLELLDLLLGRWEAGADADLHAGYVERSVTLGRDVQVQLTDGPLTGRAVAVAADGRLVVRTGAAERVLGAGDVVHLR